MTDDWIGVAGDWHGAKAWGRHSIYQFHKEGITNVFQVGDFGLGWPGGGWKPYINEISGACVRWDVFLHIIEGNHENYDYIEQVWRENDPAVPAEIAPRVFLLPRNYRFDLPHDRTALALGGAPSIDYPSRQIGRSWWPEEALKLEEVEKAAEEGHADIMFCHDSPDGGTYEVQRIIDSPDAGAFWSQAGLNYAREGREMMNIAYAGVQPKLFAHGHFHVAGSCVEEDGRRFLSLSCNGFRKSMAKINLETLDHEWLDPAMDIPR